MFLGNPEERYGVEGQPVGGADRQAGEGARGHGHLYHDEPDVRWPFQPA